MAFTKITAAGIGSTETVTLDGLSVINDVSIGGTVSIAGTLTYEDVTNVDSVGLITARNGIVVGSGITLSKDGDGFFTGIVTATTFSGTFSGDGTSLTGVASTDNIRTNTNATFLQNINVSGTVTATSYAGDGSALTGIAATDNVRTGILDVAGISTFRNTMNVGAAVTISESGIEASGIGITCANINGTQIGGRRNLSINGACEMAQRGTSSTTYGYGSVDRFAVYYYGHNEAPTHSQSDVASGTTPYSLGFRKALKVTNGNQTSGAGAAQFMQIQHKYEAQDIAKSGWNYTSTSSFITVQFWVKASVAQTYYAYLRSYDGTGQRYYWSFALSADTWTKVVKTIPGNSNLQFDNDANQGFHINWGIWYGTDYTASGLSAETWAAYASGTRVPDMTSTWWTTNDATFEVTGVQMEVGSQATAFEHRSHGEEILLCQRYYQQILGSSDLVMWGSGRASTSSVALVNTPLSVPLRASPTISETSYTTWGTAGSHSVDNETPTVQYFAANNTFLPMQFHSTSSLTNARVATVACRDGSSLIMDAEI